MKFYLNYEVFQVRVCRNFAIINFSLSAIIILEFLIEFSLNYKNIYRMKFKFFLKLYYDLFVPYRG